MNDITMEEKKLAVDLIISTIHNCEGMLPKFDIGTSQHSLLVNRIRALKISQNLLEKENRQSYSEEELHVSLRPIQSIISKCTKAQQKFEVGTSHYNRFARLIQAMNIAKAAMEYEIAMISQKK